VLPSPAQRTHRNPAAASLRYRRRPDRAEGYILDASVSYSRERPAAGFGVIVAGTAVSCCWAPHPATQIRVAITNIAHRFTSSPTSTSFYTSLKALTSR
jgi:hypothetical protein